MSSNLPHNAPASFDWVVRLEDWRLEHNALHLSGETAHGKRITVTLRAVSDTIWRITAVPPHGTIDPPTGIVVGDVGPPPLLQVDETDTGLTVSGLSLPLHVDRDPWALRFEDQTGQVICRENPGDIDGLGRPFVLPLGYFYDADDVLRVTESFHLRPDEHLYGLGEKFTPLDKQQQRIVTWTQDAFGSTSERSHKNIPFMLSTRGYGVFLDTGARITWDLGNVSCQSYTMTVESGALDAYIMYGPDPAAILERYTALTGRAPVPPKWTFGLWLSSTGAYRDQDAIQRLIDGLDEHDIPADVIHIDTWWMRWRKYCDFCWDRDAFPDVEGFIADLHAQGYRLSLWEHPYISIESDLYEVGRQNGYFLTRPDGEVYVIDYGLSLAPRPDGVVRIATPETSWNARVAIVDITNPNAVAWFQDLHRPVLQMGADVFKTDFGEDIPEDAVFDNGQTGATMHNLYPLYYNRAVFEVTEQERGDGVVWGRAGTAGSQRYPICWSGDPAADFDSLAGTIRGGLSIGLSGVPFWSHDIGAFRDLPSPELYVRWAQFGLFSSHSRMHGDSPREPWYFGPEATAIVREYVKLRYALFPYLYSAAHEASRTGMPVIRAMPLAFPEDDSTHGHDLQYMLGPWLLVAPIYDNSGQRSVYLPAGRWIDYWTGAAYDGPANLHVDVPLDTLPLFVRGGAIIPMMPAARRIPDDMIDPLIVALYPHGTTEFELLEDDGGTTFACRAESARVTCSVTGHKARRFIFQIKHRSDLEHVRVLQGELTAQSQLEDGTLEMHFAPTPALHFACVP